MCLDLSSPHDACQRRKIKKEQIENFDSLHKSKYIKVKDRPFAEGSRGCHALICLYAQSLSAKEHHVILPLVIATFIMQSIAFIALPSQVRTTLNFILHFQKQFLLPYCTDDNLLEGSCSIYRQVWWTLKTRFGFKSFWMHKQYLYLVWNFWLARMGGKHHMLNDLWQYNFYVNMNKHNPLCCLPCPTSTILAYNILMGAHNHKRFPRQCICM